MSTRIDELFKDKSAIKQEEIKNAMDFALKQIVEKSQRIYLFF